VTLNDQFIFILLDIRSKRCNRQLFPKINFFLQKFLQTIEAKNNLNSFLGHNIIAQSGSTIILG